MLVISAYAEITNISKILAYAEILDRTNIPPVDNIFRNKLFPVAPAHKEFRIRLDNCLDEYDYFVSTYKSDDRDGRVTEFCRNDHNIDSLDTCPVKV